MEGLLASVLGDDKVWLGPKPLLELMGLEIEMDDLCDVL